MTCLWINLGQNRHPALQTLEGMYAADLNVIANLSWLMAEREIAYTHSILKFRSFLGARRKNNNVPTIDVLLINQPVQDLAQLPDLIL